MQIPRPGDTKFRVLVEVNDHCAANATGPTISELQERIHLGSRSAVQFHIDDLVEMGLLARLPYKPRGLRPTSRGKKLVDLLTEE